MGFRIFRVCQIFESALSLFSSLSLEIYLFDVREAAEWEKEHIAGTISIPYKHVG
jgi:rhodanese-related sulfurtransferase